MVSFKRSIVYMYGLGGSDVFRGILFPLYASRLGFSDLQIGIILTLFTIVALIAYYPASLVTEKFGAKLSLYVSQLTYFASLTLISFTTHIIGLFLAYAILGVAQAFLIQRNTMILTNAESKEELNAIYSSVNGASLLGRLMGSLGVALLYFDPITIYFKISFLILGLLWLTPLPLIHGLNDTRKAQKLSFSPQRQVLSYSVVSLFTGFGENIIVTLLQLYYNELGASLLDISLIYVGTSAVGYAGTFVAGRMSKRVVLGYLSSTLVYALAAPFIGLPLIYSVIALTVYSFVRFARNVFGSVIRGEILKSMGQAEKGYGTSSITSTLGDSAGTFLQGYLFNLGEYDFPFIIGAASMVGGSLLHYYFYRKYVGSKQKTQL
ncbi:MAG: MFS transporter [Thermoprotei archaeon]